MLVKTASFATLAQQLLNLVLHFGVRKNELYFLQLNTKI